MWIILDIVIKQLLKRRGWKRNCAKQEHHRNLGSEKKKKGLRERWGYQGKQTIISSLRWIEMGRVSTLPTLSVCI